MRYSIRQYAEALLLALEDKNRRERREVIGRFLVVLRKKRDGAKLTQIIKTLELLQLKKEGLHKVVLESASPPGLKIKTEVEKILGKKIFIEERINPELMAGIRILVDEEIFIDASAKRRLDVLFPK